MAGDKGSVAPVKSGDVWRVGFFIPLIPFFVSVIGMAIDGAFVTAELMVLGLYVTLPAVLIYGLTSLLMHKFNRLAYPWVWSVSRAARLGAVIVPLVFVTLSTFLPWTLPVLLVGAFVAPVAFAILQGAVFHWLWSYLATRPNAWQSTRQFALMMGANPQAKNAKGESVLQCANRSGHQKVVDRLLALGVDCSGVPELALPNLNRLLHDSVRQKSDMQIIQDLLGQGADPLVALHPDNDLNQPAKSAFAIAIENKDAASVGQFRQQLGLASKQQKIPLELFKMALVHLEDGTCYSLLAIVHQDDLVGLQLSVAAQKRLPRTWSAIQTFATMSPKHSARPSQGGRRRETSALARNHMYAVGPSVGDAVVAVDADGAKVDPRDVAPF